MLAILCAACANDDNDEPPVAATPHYISTITEDVYYIGFHAYTEYQFNYDGTVLRNITTPGQQIAFSYEGNKIQNATYLTNGQPESTKSFHYEGDLLDYTLFEDDSHEKTAFSYLNGVLSRRQATYQNGFNTIILGTETMAFANGNRVSNTYQHGFDGTYYTDSFEFDAHYGAFRDMNPYVRMTFETESLFGLNANNIVASERAYPQGSETERYIYKWTYDVQGFPLNVKKYSDPGHTLISNTIITYM